MRLTSITAENFLGIAKIDVDLTAPVTLFAGKNGAGKSSVRDAVAMALTGVPERIALKKEYGELVRHGCKKGRAAVGFEGVAAGPGATCAGTSFVELPSGKGAQLGKEMAALMPYVLDAHHFARRTPEERRHFLFRLMGVAMNRDGITARMVEKGLPAERVKDISPWLSAGFEAAAKEAASKARDAKAQWKTVTGGETWGSDKGEGWQPEALPPRADHAADLAENARKKMAEIDASLAALEREHGRLESEWRAARAHAQSVAARRAELAEKAARLARAQAKLEHDQQELATWEGIVAKTRAAAAGGRPQGLIHDLAYALAHYIDDDASQDTEIWEEADRAKRAYETQYGRIKRDVSRPDPEAVAKLPEHESAYALLVRTVENDRRDILACETAAAELATLETQAPPPNEEATEKALAEIRAQIERDKQAKGGWMTDYNKYRSIASQFALREKTIADARRLHTEILGWQAIAEALSPNGIPADLLADAITPLNDRLDGAVWCGGVLVHIGDDMSIAAACDGKSPTLYQLLSESEQWRVDAQIAAAIAEISGVGILTLDRFDVLDLPTRSAALKWARSIAGGSGISNVLLFGTLKARPEQLPAGVVCHWIESGEIAATTTGGV